jgi:hypothetical protein
MQPLGIRDKADDKQQQSGTLTLVWGNAEAEVVGS